MKKFLSIIILTLLFTSNYVKAVDREGDIQGCYFVTIEHRGSSWTDAPISIYFQKDGTCEYTDHRGTLQCQCYIISSGEQRLHLIANHDFNGEQNLTIINLRFQGTRSIGLEEYYLYLGEYDDLSKSVTMRKQNSQSRVNAIMESKCDDNVKYSLSGIQTESPTGVYIQSGKKKLSR